MGKKGCETHRTGVVYGVKNRNELNQLLTK